MAIVLLFNHAQALSLTRTHPFLLRLSEMKIVQLASFLNAFVDSSDRMLSAHNEMLLRVERAHTQAVLRPGDDKNRVVGREREKEERQVLREKEKERDRERQREGTSVKSNESGYSGERDSDSRTALKRRDRDKEREKDKDIVEESHVTALRSDIEYELERNDSPVANPISKSASTSAVTVTHTGVGVGGGAGTGAGTGAEATAWLSKEALDNLNTECSDSDSLLSAYSHATKTKRKALNKKKASASSGDIRPHKSGISISLLKENVDYSERGMEIDNEGEKINSDIFNKGSKDKSKSEDKSESKNKNKELRESKNGNDEIEVDVEEEVSLCSDDSFESALEDPTPAPASNPTPHSSSHPHLDPMLDPSHSDGSGVCDNESEDEEEDEDESEDGGDDDGDSEYDGDSVSGTSDGALEEAEKFNELIGETESLRSQLMSNIRLVESDRSKADVLRMLQLELSGCEDSLRALKIAYIESLMLANTADIDLEKGRGRCKEDEDAAEGTYCTRSTSSLASFFLFISELFHWIDILFYCFNCLFTSSFV